jgi:hypothetical protein
MNTKSQIDFDHLLQLHMLDQTEVENDIPWGFCMVVNYFKEKEIITAQITSVW